MKRTPREKWMRMVATGLVATICCGGHLSAALAAQPVKTEKPEKLAVDPRDIDIAPVGLPIVWQDRLINYVFVKVRLHASTHGDPVKLREKEPWLRDALVRAGTRTPFVLPWDFIHVDVAAVSACLMQASTRILGPGEIVRVDVTSQKPQRTTGLPVEHPPEPPASSID